MTLSSPPFLWLRDLVGSLELTRSGETGLLDGPIYIRLPAHNIEPLFLAEQVFDTLAKQWMIGKHKDTLHCPCLSLTEHTSLDIFI